ncbi:phosphoglycerate kinase [Aliidongia dinghuensis]|uniref:Phosphoglycerate kinase n=1 Tax=Aliidongia dinghuensis TaxID=1867774 RepID=A0A8J2YV36_9PROT|nr:phosphoglycerate kinase [Aliidongia dinghuensis]GGF22072.1 phosphoglycerate kinase [Aliidongia dinghuensis]
MVAYKTLDQLDVAGKRVLVRVDLNVPMQDGKVTDATRIERLVPTIEQLAKAGARVVLLSHFGRPKGRHAPEASLGQLAEPLSAALGGRKIAFGDDCIGPEAERVVDALKDGEVALLENLRFHPGEETNDPAFASALAKLGDLYVNDAFSAAHRAHASTEALAHLLPSAAGLLMQAELEALGAALEHPERPVAAIVGGSKVSTKLDLLNSLVGKVDLLVIGGAMANTMLLARGAEVGTSLVERDMLDTARAIFAAADKAGCTIVLPEDAVVAAKLTAGQATETVAIDRVPADLMILDAGPKTVAAIVAKLEGAKTLVWNGPVGAFEFPPFDEGTNAIAQEVARLVQAGKLLAVAGGGDTVSAMAHAGVIDKLSYVSTAGGAFLEWLEGRELPGVKALAS